MVWFSFSRTWMTCFGSSSVAPLSSARPRCHARGTGSGGPHEDVPGREVGRLVTADKDRLAGLEIADGGCRGALRLPLTDLRLAIDRESHRRAVGGRDGDRGRGDRLDLPEDRLVRDVAVGVPIGDPLGMLEVLQSAEDLLEAVLGDLSRSGAGRGRRTGTTSRGDGGDVRTGRALRGRNRHARASGDESNGGDSADNSGLGPHGELLTIEGAVDVVIDRLPPPWTAGVRGTSGPHEPSSQPSPQEGTPHGSGRDSSRSSPSATQPSSVRV